MTVHIAYEVQARREVGGVVVVVNGPRVNVSERRRRRGAWTIHASNDLSLHQFLLLVPKSPECSFWSVKWRWPTRAENTTLSVGRSTSTNDFGLHDQIVPTTRGCGTLTAARWTLFQASGILGTDRLHRL